jgi:hypothetical protein
MDRQPSIELSIGIKGSGKTWRTVQNIVQYVVSHLKRKVVVFDTNGEPSYQAFAPINATDIGKLKKVATVRRVKPENAYTGAPFDLDEKAQMAFYLLANVQDGLLVLDDLNNYLLGANIKAFISKITTNRQPSLDITINFQSFGAIMPRLWQNANFMRLHYTNENLKNIKKKMPDYDLYRLAQIIIAQHYNAGFKRRFMYIDMQANKMMSISENEESADEPCTYRKVTKEELTQAAAIHLGMKKEPTHPIVSDFVNEKMYYIL